MCTVQQRDYNVVTVTGEDSGGTEALHHHCLAGAPQLTIMTPYDTVIDLTDNHSEKVAITLYLTTTSATVIALTTTTTTVQL